MHRCVENSRTEQGLYYLKDREEEKISNGDTSIVVYGWVWDLIYPLKTSLGLRDHVCFTAPAHIRRISGPFSLANWSHQTKAIFQPRKEKFPLQINGRIYRDRPTSSNTSPDREAGSPLLHIEK
jgi:hypothetical protein